MKSVQRLSLSRSRQASRLRPVPDKLRDYIRLANVIPQKEDLPELLPEPIAQLSIQAATPEQWNWVVTTIRDQMAQFPLFRTFMKDVDLRQNPPVEAYRKAHDLKVIRDVLRTLARCNKEKLVTESLPIGAYLESLVTVRTDPEGRLQIERSRLLEALDGVEIVRIRICKRCRQIFWAGRVDMTCCSSPCTHAERQRRWREKFLKKYKLQRATKAQAEDARKREKESARMARERTDLESVNAPFVARRTARLPQ